MMYWHIGERINRDILDKERAAYGQKIVATVSRQLWWSHFIEVLPIKDELQREFYDGFIRMLYIELPKHTRQKYLLTVKGLAIYNQDKRYDRKDINKVL